MGLRGLSGIILIVSRQDLLPNVDPADGWDLVRKGPLFLSASGRRAWANWLPSMECDSLKCLSASGSMPVASGPRALGVDWAGAARRQTGRP